MIVNSAEPPPEAIEISAAPGAVPKMFVENTGFSPSVAMTVSSPSTTKSSTTSIEAISL